MSTYSSNNPLEDSLENLLEVARSSFRFVYLESFDYTVDGVESLCWQVRLSHAGLTSDDVFIMGDPGESATSVLLKALGSSIRRNQQANSSPDKPISVEPTDLDYLIEESARWRTVAEHLARNLGKVEYANAAYQDLLDSDPFAN